MKKQYLFIIGLVMCIGCSSVKQPKQVESKIIALTFDDGPNTSTTIQVLDLLEEYHVVASFFLIGDKISDTTKPIVQRAYEMKCEINNHSKTHPSMDKLTAKEIQEEINYTTDKIYETVGERPHFFRPPYIAVNELMYQNISLPFICGYGANDWEESVSAAKRAELVLSQAKDGSIILLHDFQGNIKTIEALKVIIPKLKAEGYQFVTVSDLFRLKGVTPKMNKIYSSIAD